MMGWGGAGEQGAGWRKGPWTPEEDKLLARHVTLHGEGRWSYVARFTGLNRSAKSSRLRWVNYLRPGLKKGQLTPQEEGIIIELHSLWGNKWSTIASYLPGRTDNEIKNYWRTHFKKKDKLFDKQDKRKAQFLQQRNQLQQQNEANSMMMITRVSPSSSSSSSHNETNNEIIKMDTDSREHECQKQQNFNCMNNMIFMQPDLMEDDNYSIGAWSLSSEQYVVGDDHDSHQGFWDGLWNFVEP